MFPSDSRLIPKLTFRQAGLAGLLVSVLGCAQAMNDQPRFEVYEETDFFGDGKADRHAIPGTVPWQPASAHDDAYDEQLTRGMDNGQWAETIPPQLLRKQGARDLLIRGRERYEIFCAPCHDPAGSGNGRVPQRGFPFPPTFHSERLRRQPVGYLYQVATKGYGRMPDYERMVPVEDRWAISAYIRALQISQYAPVNQLSAEDRDTLETLEQ